MSTLDPAKAAPALTTLFSFNESLNPLALPISAEPSTCSAFEYPSTAAEAFTAVPIFTSTSESMMVPVAFMSAIL